MKIKYLLVLGLSVIFGTTFLNAATENVAQGKKFKATPAYHSHHSHHSR